MGDKYKVDVVICCYNSSKVIADALVGIQAQKFNDNISLSIIVVDNASTDNTRQIVEGIFSKMRSIDCTVVYEATPGIMNARKKGVENANGDFLVFVDDDNVLENDWVQICCDLFIKYPAVGGIGGYNEPILLMDQPGWFCDYSQTYACGSQGAEAGAITKDKQTLFGAGLAFRTALIKEVLFHGPNLLLSGRTKNKFLRGDDSEICMRSVLLGWDLYYCPELKLKHLLQAERVNWEYVIKTRFAGGMASIFLDIYADLIWGSKPKTFKKVFILVMRQCFQNMLDVVCLSCKVQGDKRAFNGAFIRGRIYGLFYYGPKYYNQALKDISQLV